MINSNSRLSDIILAEPAVLTVLNRFDIRLGVGDRTVGRVSEQCGVDTDMLVCLLNTFLHADYFPEQHLAAVGVTGIIDYLTKTNAYYSRFMLPNVDRHFGLLVSRSQGTNGNLHLMMNYFDEIKKQLLDRIAHDERHWFPAIIAANNGGDRDALRAAMPAPVGESVVERLEDLMSMFVIHLTGDYDMHLGQAVLQAMASLRNDLVQNNRIRDRILRPLVDKLLA